MDDNSVSVVEYTNKNGLTLRTLMLWTNDKTDFMIIVPHRWFREAKVIGEYIVNGVIDTEYDGDMEKYIRDVKRGKRMGVHIELDPKLDNDTFKIVGDYN